MSKPGETSGQTVYPAVRYVDARAAIAWLERAFGAKTHVVYDDSDGTVAHAEIAIAGNLIMLGNSREDGSGFRSPKETNGVTGSIYVALPDAAVVDALFALATAAGAKITQPVHDTDYGSHDFGALDIEGHPWSFGTYAPQA
jgi:uncharacterized glyoxalase superfamily protein PhnB